MVSGKRGYARGGRVRLRTLDPITLRLLLLELRPGQELDLSIDEVCAALQLPAILDASALSQIAAFASKNGCEFTYDEFGHYRSSFRKITERA